MLEPQILLLPATPNVKLAVQRAVFSIAAFAGKAAALREALHAALPSTPTRIEANGITYLWSGADSWLAIAEDPASFAAPIAAAASLAAITDQSDGRAIFTVIGADMRARLAALVPIDLHEAVFTENVTALTLAGHIPIQIWRTQKSEFQLACFRSYAASLYHALVEAI